MKLPIHHIQEIFSRAFEKHKLARLNFILPVSNGWLAILRDLKTKMEYSCLIKPVVGKAVHEPLMYSQFEKETAETHPDATKLALTFMKACEKHLVNPLLVRDAAKILLEASEHALANLPKDVLDVLRKEYDDNKPLAES